MRQRGAALVIVLWTAMLLSMALAAAIGAARIETKLTAMEWRSFAAREAAKNGLDYAAHRIAVREGGRLDQLRRFKLSMNGYDVTFSPSLESEKLDINLASEQTLASFFRFLGQPLQDADALAARIADWRDEDDLARPNGAEGRDYVNARNGERIGDRLFYSADELRLVLGFSEDLLTCALPALTIFGDSTPPSRGLMQFLYSGDMERPHNAERVRLENDARNAAAGRRYAITATARKTNGASERAFVLTGVFRITGRREQPYEWIAQFTESDENAPKVVCDNLDRKFTDGA
jgi:hypothetical protein